MSQNMQGDAGIVLVKAPLSVSVRLWWKHKISSVCLRILLFNVLGFLKKNLGRRKISARFKSKLSPRGNAGARQEASAYRSNSWGGPLVFEGWGDDSRMSSVCKVETQVKQFWTCQVLSGCHFRQKCILTWKTYMSDVCVCVNTLLISSFQSAFRCFKFPRTDKSWTYLIMVPDCSLVPGLSFQDIHTLAWWPPWANQRVSFKALTLSPLAESARHAAVSPMTHQLHAYY